MSETLHIATYNIHKGFSNFNRRMMLHELRDQLRVIRPNVMFLQEVLGSHRGFAERYHNWPVASQYEFLAESIWDDFAYGKNATYPEGHHGNAILSQFPITKWENIDVSAHRFEHRGLLHVEIDLPGWHDRLHCVCVHLGLFSRGRKKQLYALRERIERLVPTTAPLIVAGDFNDWRSEAGDLLARGLHMHEAFEHLHGVSARSYPAMLPVFRLDRIYIRGLRVKSAEIHRGRPWSKISDHAALSAVMTRA